MDVAKSNASIIWTPSFEWCVVRWGSKRTSKRHKYERDWTMLYIYVMRTILICSICCANCVSHILHEVGAKRKVSKLHMSTLS